METRRLATESVRWMDGRGSSAVRRFIYNQRRTGQCDTEHHSRSAANVTEPPREQYRSPRPTPSKLTMYRIIVRCTVESYFNNVARRRRRRRERLTHKMYLYGTSESAFRRVVE